MSAIPDLFSELYEQPPDLAYQEWLAESEVVIAQRAFGLTIADFPPEIFELLYEDNLDPHEAADIVLIDEGF